MSESIDATDPEESRFYDLSLLPEWQNLISHFELSEGFAFIVLIVPDADGVETCKLSLNSYLETRAQQLEILQFDQFQQIKELPNNLLDLEIPPGTGVLWVSAISSEKDEDNDQWQIAWREGCAHLNKFRNHLRDKFNVPILFVGPQWLQIALREMAPDLWSIRTLVVRIESAEVLLFTMIKYAQIQGTLELNLSGKGIKQLPASIGQLTELQRLYLTNNQLQELPETIVQLTQLQSLSLADNQLQELPETIGQLTQLQKLYLYSNQLQKLPETIGQLTQLRGLYLNYNQLGLLPKTIGQLSQLEELYLANNQLQELPETIGQLTQLRKLYLDNNQLSVLPKSLQRLHLLEMLFLHGNDRLNLPEEILGPKWTDVFYKKIDPGNPAYILNYYFHARNSPFNEARLILLGDVETGKTSLVNRLVFGRFSNTGAWTRGIKVNEWDIQISLAEKVRLQIWDFGSQEIINSIHRLLLTPDSLYLLVIDGDHKDPNANADYWLRVIERFGGESPVIVVVNKATVFPIDLDRRALQKAHATIREFISTDCREGIGINELQRSIQREVSRLEHLNKVFPANWFDIKKALAEIKENYISFDQYQQICIKFGEADESAQATLLSLLHYLGELFHYERYTQLAATIVLNGGWLLNGLNKIINAEELLKQKGEFYFKDLAKLLEPDLYPTEIHPFFIDLMKQYELCLSFFRDANHYLIPQLLNKTAPKEAGQFSPKDCLNFQYHYSIPPEGVLPQFIVRSHALSKRELRWQTGVILQFENNRALVKVDVLEKKVLILISGPLSGRRKLLAMIRADFEHIHHQSLLNLGVAEMVPLSDTPQVLISYQELIVMERNGINRFPKVVGAVVIEIDVQEMLNGLGS